MMQIQKQAVQQTGSDGATSYIFFGAFAILSLFGGLAAWSIFAPFQGATVAVATVQVETNRKAIQHLEGGIVKEIRVADGDYVKAGDLLIRLDDTVFRAQLAVIDAQLNEHLARRARLIAERDGAKKVTWPQELTSLDQTTATVEIVEGQNKLFLARREGRDTEITLLNQRVIQLHDQIVGTKAQRNAKRQQLRIMTDEIEDLKKLLEQGHATRPRLRAMERSRVETVGDEAKFSSQIAEAKSSIVEAEMRVLSLTKGFREKVLTELREVQTEISNLRERRITARDSLRRVEVRAPREGRVFSLQVHTIGGVVSPGQPILHIVPKDDKLVVAAQVRPQDIDKVRKGDKTRVRFPAFSQRFTPEAEGRVKTVSADALKKEGGDYYLATIEIDPDSLATAGNLELLPGMPAEAFIHSDTRTVVSFLLKPLVDAVAHSFRE